MRSAKPELCCLHYFQKLTPDQLSNSWCKQSAATLHRSPVPFQTSKITLMIALPTTASVMVVETFTILVTRWTIPAKIFLQLGVGGSDFSHQQFSMAGSTGVIKSRFLLVASNNRHKWFLSNLWLCVCTTLLVLRNKLNKSAEILLL